MTTTKQDEFAIKVQGALSELFREESDYYLGDDFKEDDNLTTLMHVISNIVPTHLYNGLTGEDLNMLDFNHIANKLVFQNVKLNDNGDITKE